MVNSSRNIQKVSLKIQEDFFDSDWLEITGSFLTASGEGKVSASMLRPALPN